MWFYSVLTSDLRAFLCRVTPACLALLLLCGCGSAASPAPPLPPTFKIEWTLAGSTDRLAAELVDSARMSNVFKLTYEEMSDIYGIELAPFEELTVYTPGVGDDPNALFFGCTYTREDIPAAKQELTAQLKSLRAANPEGKALQNAQTVVYGRYILLVAAADNDQPIALLTRRLRTDSFAAA